MHVYCDFDGTISVEDATDLVLDRLADPKWELLEEQWKRGEIGSGECMRRQIALIEATQQELDAALRDVVIDPGFSSFAALCDANSIPLTIVSDGVDYFIRRVLARHGLGHLPVIANRLTIDDEHGRLSYTLSSPYADQSCLTASGVCKCRSLTPDDLRIYIGDGRSDFCVSNKPELVFAKASLADYCADQNIPFIAYQSFSDLKDSLMTAIPGLRDKAFETPRHVAA
jgi:2,3-diketo-5-methylthio-1-phosphopentane phosphatase